MRHWGVLATCVFCTFGCAAVAFSVPGLCYRPVSQYLGVDVFDVSLYMTIVYLTEVVLSAPVGRLLQRFDMRIVCTAAGEHEAQFAMIDPVDKKPVALDVEFAESDRKSVV